MLLIATIFIGTNRVLPTRSRTLSSSRHPRTTTTQRSSLALRRAPLAAQQRASVTPTAVRSTSTSLRHAVPSKTSRTRMSLSHPPSMGHPTTPGPRTHVCPAHARLNQHRRQQHHQRFRSCGPRWSQRQRQFHRSQGPCPHRRRQQLSTLSHLAQMHVWMTPSDGPTRMGLFVPITKHCSGVPKKEARGLGGTSHGGRSSGTRHRADDHRLWHAVHVVVVLSHP